MHKSKKPNVLVVDDEPDIRWALELILKSAGFAVSVAESGAEALEKFYSLQAKWDLIFLDVNLPDIDGIELARQIKILAHCSAPIVLISGYFYLADSQVELSLESGLISTFIAKPFHHDAILKVIARLPPKLYPQ